MKVALSSYSFGDYLAKDKMGIKGCMEWAKEQGFEGFEVRELVAPGDVLGYRYVAGGDGTRVPLVAAEGFSYALAPGEEPELVLSPQYYSYAPVTEGRPEGDAYVLLDGQVVGQIPLVWGSSMTETKQKERTLLERLFGGT